MRYYPELLLALLLFGLALLAQHRLAHTPVYLGMLVVLAGARWLMPATMFSGWLKVAWVACVVVVGVGLLVEFL